MARVTEFFLTRLAGLLARYPKTALFLGLVYLVWPLDLVPEAGVGILGFVDDIFILLLPILARYYIQKRKSSLRSSSGRAIDTTATKNLPERP
jgi:uncharacterized membrane protein YkvA (DUF1232 family)